MERLMFEKRRIAYFSMEIGFEASMPTYSGGLGVLAGDTVRAAADLKVPMVAVTLLHRRGYCRQMLDHEGNQSEQPVDWDVEQFLTELPARVTLTIEERRVTVRAWQYTVLGFSGYRLPVIFLDTDLPDNDPADREFTNHLYGGDERYRLCQEAVLGIGGVRMLEALGCKSIERYHMNEGHAALLPCQLLDQQLGERAPGDVTSGDIDDVRKRCVFTTHTPVDAGHDQFPMDVVARVLSRRKVELLRKLSCVDGTLNMTYLALHLSRFVNGVARRHGEVSRKMFAPYEIDAITNGVHARTWVTRPFADLFDKYIPTWCEDANSLRQVLSIPNDVIWNAHRQSKDLLLNRIREYGVRMRPDCFTIGFARRAATYKRADLLFDDLDRLKYVFDNAGAFQVIFAGKAHPRDEDGKEVIRRIFRAKAGLEGKIQIAYLPDYDIDLCRVLVAGVDLWLNTPEPPLEASGTSGMKAALNGVPSLSVPDGWWVEGCIEGITGWSIGDARTDVPSDERRRSDADAFYEKLEKTILPMYYQSPERFVEVMRYAIALNGSFFNAQRMMHQYVLKAYFG